MKRKLPSVLLSILLLIGIGLILYPSIGNRMAGYQQRQAIKKMQDYVAQMETEQCSLEWDQAVNYNQAKKSVEIRDPFETADVHPKSYHDILNFGDGVMAELLIPDIEVDLPIYHGTEDAALEHGVGHLDQTSLPIGGEGTHAVLVGHTGLPGAMLLTDLEQLKIGERFYITVMNDMLTYQVDQILVVEPDDTSALEVVQGEDYVTLVTCTPYGINTQRLLVRGTRVTDAGEAEFYEKEMHVGKDWREIWREMVILFGALAAPAAIGLLWTARRRQKR